MGKSCDLETVNKDSIRCTLPPGRGFDKTITVVLPGGAKKHLSKSGSVSFEGCDEGFGEQGNDCMPCEPGQFSAGGAAKCERCFAGTFSFGRAKSCKKCPLRGATCPDGILTPLAGYWSPAVMSPTGNTEEFAVNTTVFECLTAESCNASTTWARTETKKITPATAYNCSKGHRGTLCAQCAVGYYFHSKRCKRCSKEFLSPGATAALVAIACAGALAVAYKLVLRCHAGPLKRVLHGRRKALGLRLLDMVRGRRRRKKRRRRRRRRRGMQGGEHGAEDHEDATTAAVPAIVRWRTIIEVAAIRVIHASLRSAKRSNLFGASETLRILLNIGKVITHLVRLPSHTSLLLVEYLQLLMSAPFFNLLGVRQYGGVLVYCVTPVKILQSTFTHWGSE